MSYWKFGGGYSYRTPRSKKTGWSKTLAGVPASAKTKATTKTTKKKASSKSVKKTTKKRSGFTLGGFSPMGIAKAGALYLGVLFGVSRAAPQITAIPGAVEVATGVVASTTGLPGVAFIALGAAKFVATTALRYVNGGLGNGGGYDY